MNQTNLTISVIQTRWNSEGKQGNKFNLARAIKGPVSHTIALTEVFKFLLQLTGQRTCHGYMQCRKTIHELNYTHSGKSGRFA